MPLFRRAPAPRPSPRPVLSLPLTDTDITEITQVVEAEHCDARIQTVHGTLLVHGLLVRFSITDLRRSGYIIHSNGDYSFTVTGWDANHPHAGHRTVAELDERIDHLLALRQRAEAANHLTTAQTEET